MRSTSPHGLRTSTWQRADANGVSAFEQKLGDVRGMAQQDPKAVANIIKNWTNINAS